jgi:hypothetical protein
LRTFFGCRSSRFVYRFVWYLLRDLLADCLLKSLFFEHHHVLFGRQWVIVYRARILCYSGRHQDQHGHEGRHN